MRQVISPELLVRIRNRRAAVAIIQSRLGYRLFNPLVNQLTGASVTLGNVFIVIVLLKLWQKKNFEDLIRSELL